MRQDMRKARGALASAAATAARKPDDPAAAAAVLERRREYRAVAAEDYITRLLAETPPLSEEDRAHLSRLLTDPRGEAPTAPDAG